MAKKKQANESASSAKPAAVKKTAKKQKEEQRLKEEIAIDAELEKLGENAHKIEEILLPKEEEKKEESKDESKDKRREIVKSSFARERVLTEATDEARNFYAKSAYGTILEDGKVQLALPEALYLLQKGKIEIREGKKNLTTEEFIDKARKVEPNFWIRYCVFKDMRDRGYIVKTALKFGADFRVYDRGIKPGEDHARWVVFPVHEGETLTWYEFAAKNRVAHSTKKRLLMGIVDDEGDVTYYEIKWTRP